MKNKLALTFAACSLAVGFVAMAGAYAAPASLPSDLEKFCVVNKLPGGTGSGVTASITQKPDFGGSPVQIATFGTIFGGYQNCISMGWANSALKKDSGLVPITIFEVVSSSNPKNIAFCTSEESD